MAKLKIIDIRNFQFSDEQKAAYQNLIEARSRCIEAGLVLDARGEELFAYDESFNHKASYAANLNSKIEVPVLKGCWIDHGSEYPIPVKFDKEFIE